MKVIDRIPKNALSTLSVVLAGISYVVGAIIDKKNKDNLKNEIIKEIQESSK